MRAKRKFRASFAAQAAAGALVLTVPPAAAAAIASAAPSTAAPTGAGPVSMQAVVANDVAHPSPRQHFVVNDPHIVRRVGSVVRLGGYLLPGRRHETVYLITRQGHSWRVLQRAHVGARGNFAFKYHVGRGNRWLRVAGGHTSAILGSVKGVARAALTRRATVRGGGWNYATVSWYNDQTGQTASGVHDFYGVANKTLPFGTKVQFKFGGRTVIATVDDRGPYVAGRSFDLNQNTSRALGMTGVGTVGYRYVN